MGVTTAISHFLENISFFIHGIPRELRHSRPQVGGGYQVLGSRWGIEYLLSDVLGLELSFEKEAICIETIMVMLERDDAGNFTGGFFQFRKEWQIGF
jgi:hypothetical protein